MRTPPTERTPARRGSSDSVYTHNTAWVLAENMFSTVTFIRYLGQAIALRDSLSFSQVTRTNFSLSRMLSRGVARLSRRARDQEELPFLEFDLAARTGNGLARSIRFLL